MGKSIFEQMGGTYTLGEDGMYYPDLKLPTDEEPRYGKYGRIRKTFLQKHRYGLYLEFLLNSQLESDLSRVISAERSQIINVKFLQKQGATVFYGNLLLFSNSYRIKFQ